MQENPALVKGSFGRRNIVLGLMNFQERSRGCANQNDEGRGRFAISRAAENTCNHGAKGI